MSISKSEVLNIVSAITTKQDIIKSYIETSDVIQAKVAEIKDLQEELKALIEADVEIFTAKEELKDLQKDLKAASKQASLQLKNKGVDVKPAQLTKFFKTAYKGSEKVDEVVATGSTFNVLNGVL